MLLTAADLPSGPWRQLDQRTWRTGAGDPSTGRARRAGEIGSVTAWRSFRHADRDGWLWEQVSPLASPADAGVALGDVAVLGVVCVSGHAAPAAPPLVRWDDVAAVGSALATRIAEGGAPNGGA